MGSGQGYRIIIAKVSRHWRPGHLSGIFPVLRPVFWLALLGTFSVVRFRVFPVWRFEEYISRLPVDFVPEHLIFIFLEVDSIGAIDTMT